MLVIRQKRQVTEKVRSFRDRGEMLQRQLVENTVTHRTRLHYFYTTTTDSDKTSRGVYCTLI